MHGIRSLAGIAIGRVCRLMTMTANDCLYRCIDAVAGDHFHLHLHTKGRKSEASTSGLIQAPVTVWTARPSNSGRTLPELGLTANTEFRLECTLWHQLIIVPIYTIMFTGCCCSVQCIALAGLRWSWKKSN